MKHSSDWAFAFMIVGFIFSIAGCTAVESYTSYLDHKAQLEQKK